MKERPVVIMAGGTGGHIFPGLEVARALGNMQVPVCWIGGSGMESRLVPEHGFPFYRIKVSGLRGKGLLSLVLAPFKLLLGLLQSIKVFIGIKPRAVLGMGGYVAGPGGVAARLLGIPLYLHEQNAVPGITNRLLCRFAKQVYSAFPGVLESAGNVTWEGNPVRGEIEEIHGMKREYLKNGTRRVLIIGGSLGSGKLNQLLPGVLGELKKDISLQITHQTGVNQVLSVKEAYQAVGLDAVVEPFFNDMASVYADADLVVCRAGALTLAELAVAGLPAVLVPYPYAVDDHQTINGEYYAEKGAAFLIQESVLEKQVLCDVLKNLLHDEKRLMQMSASARKLARLNVAENIAASIVGGGDD